MVAQLLGRKVSARHLVAFPQLSPAHLHDMIFGGRLLARSRWVSTEEVRDVALPVGSNR
jgi:hypothetical protein